MIRTRTPLALVILNACSSAVGQAAVAPVEFTAAESPAFGQVAGFESRFRQQFLFDESLIRPLRGKTIRAFAFRRDQLLGLPFSRGTAALRVTISSRAADVMRPSRSFARNHGTDRREVFRGTVALPGSPSASPPIPWTPRYTARVALDTAFAYAAGNLCIEIEGTPVAPPADPRWIADFCQDSLGGRIITSGRSCGIAAQRHTITASGWGRFAIPGGTQVLHAIGRRHTPGTLLLGVTLLPTPLPLDWIGASGCTLYVDAATALSTTFDRPGESRDLGVAFVDLELPAGPRLLGARIHGQWVNLELARRSNRAGVTTSNALEIRLAAAMPPARLATIQTDDLGPTQPFPAAGHVDIARGPVLRFEY